MGRKLLSLGVVSLTALSVSACGNNNSPGALINSSGSEVAISTVSGALQSGGSSNAASFPARKRYPNLYAVLSTLLPEASAATWACTGSGFLTTYAGAGSYAYKPLSCTVEFSNGDGVSSYWDGDWNFQYGNSCGTYASGARFDPDTQPANCLIDRSSPVGGVTRYVGDQYGDQYSVTHDTTTANTGYDSKTYPTTNQGVVETCGTGGCAATRTLMINGSHLTGQVVLGGAAAETFWDQTVSTPTGGISITGSGTSRTVNGTVIVEHNLLEATSTSVLSNIVYGNANCCFPTGGTISTTYTGTKAGTTESMSFSAQCGEATLTQNKIQSAVTLLHCI